jgi:hypothetical protein
MNEHIHIIKEDTHAEVLAKILKATSRKYDCNMKIDFRDGNRIVQFVGDEALKPFIAEEVEGIFLRSKG